MVDIARGPPYNGTLPNCTILRRSLAMVIGWRQILFRIAESSRLGDVDVKSGIWVRRGRIVSEYMRLIR